MSTYGWIITIDHIQGDDPKDSRLGTMGPSDMSDEVGRRLLSGEGDTFTMRDDDGILYYTGRGIDLTDEWDEDACYAPLGDFGMPNAGAVEVSWANHRERDCG